MTAPALGRDYRLLWTAAVSSRFGDALRTPALALLVAGLTRDPRVIAAVTVAGQLPPLLFGLLGGVYADRWDRRRTMAAVDGVRAAVAAALAVAIVLDRASVPVLVAAAFLLAALGTVFDAASFALLPSVVPPAALPAANGRLQAGTAVAGGFLGAPAAGVLFALAAALPFAVDALTFAAAALLVLAVGPARTGHPHGSRATHRPAGRGRLRSVWTEAVEGVRWMRGEPTLWRVTLLTAGSNLAISGLQAVLVLYALDVLGMPPAGYGLFAAAAIVGGLGGALAAGRTAAVLGTVPALRVVLAAQTFALVGFALARHPVPGGVALALFAAGTTVWNSLWAAYGQQRVPAGLLGRVGSAQRMIGSLTAPVGGVLAGLSGAAYGVAPVAATAAVVYALVTLAAWPVLRATPTSAGGPGVGRRAGAAAGCGPGGRQGGQPGQPGHGPGR
ncbi:MFS transporter [Micromonospora thermarum]|uniref:MFS transporter n=1 Tax=Micromonospora thermarum TaxID=2720024 RepID=A0ABX0Z337_9ACTN|nr:MFS transporter [Micromonospora thermarum]NJP30631.1 MFS transporter [Micromonospora thermarum]